MKKRILAMLAAVAMMLSLAACTQGKDDVSTVGDYGEGETLFSEDTTIKLMVGSSVSWPYKEDWPMWQLFRAKVGGNIDVLSVPLEEMGRKINLLMASPEEFPDMTFLVAGKDIINANYDTGAFICIDDNLDKLPNYTAFWDSLPEGVKEESMLMRMSGDGKVYFPPNYGIHTIANTRIWMYRKDIFEKHNLKAPETMDELYEVAKKLKELYPESYPISMRDANLNLMEAIGSSWKPYFTMGQYYNYDEGKWHYGLFEPEAKMMVEYIRKLVAEGLTFPDFFGTNTKTWEQYVSNDMGFIMPDYLLRLDFFNTSLREQNPEFTLDAMMPPRATSEHGQNKIANFAYELTGWALFNTRDQQRIDNSLKLLDWMYSPEGIEFQSWGKEGVTYEVVDGERKWLVGDYDSPYAALGIGTPGMYQCVEVEANEALYTKEQQEAGNAVRQYQEEFSNPGRYLAFNKDLANERDDLKLSLDGYVGGWLSKFILGQEPMEKWDEMLEGARELGAERLLEIYIEQYDRVMNAD